MHFWIDKRSQTCGFSGRHRIPPSLTGGGGGGVGVGGCGSHQHQRRRRRSRTRGKLMVTPVHRFQPIENTGLAVGRRGHHNHRHGYLPPGYATTLTNAAPTRNGGGHAAELDSSVFLDIPVASNGIVAHNHPVHMVPVGTLRCGIWASFALAAVFIAGIKLYFDHQGSGVEVLLFFGLLVVFLVAALTASLVRNRYHINHIHVPTLQPSLGNASMTTVGNSDIDIDEEVVRSPTSTVSAPAAPQLHHQHQPPAVVQVELPPPPYHIAILLPQQQRTSVAIDESPPPAYDKVVG